MTYSKMSQSDEHRDLVVGVARAIRQRHPTIDMTTDLPQAPGDPIPPLIGGHRPDVIARSVSACFELVIAEAKTGGDIENQHTRSQIAAFVDHLHLMPKGVGIFVLAVNGQVADSARALLRFTCRQHVSSQLRIKLYDGLDFWTLGPPGEPPWRLS